MDEPTVPPSPGRGQGGLLALEQYKHPKTVVAHLAFKALAVLAYLFSSFYTSSYIIVFITVITWLSIDFWTVKNVSGRLLVGLRWWNKVAQDGSTEWVFEAKKGKAPHPNESRAFWWSLYFNTFFWGLLAFLSLLKLHFGYLLLCGIAVSLNLSNVIGYWKCDSDAKKKLSQAAARMVGEYGPGLFTTATSYFQSTSAAAPAAPAPTAPGAP